MLGHLQVVAGPDQGRAFPLEEGRTLVIGRGPNTGTHLKDLRVSRVHCKIEANGGKLLLTDNGSASGTLVNGRKVARRDVGPGDTISIGETTMRVVPAAVAEETSLIATPVRRPVANTPAGLVGSIVNHYAIESILARGRTGVVYKAVDVRDHKPVAFKSLDPDYATNEEQYRRFVRAVKTVVGLRHEHLVAVLGAGKSNHACWIAMEYVDGESLAAVIRRIGLVKMLDWRYALKVAVQVARALEAAHERQIIHRNVTPENILIRQGDDVAKLGDLILAKALDGIMARQVTGPGQIVGDLAYLPPERTTDESPVDGRADLYSMGATVYALLTGRPPIQGRSTVETIARIRDEVPTPPKKHQLAIPDRFQDVVMMCLEKRPEDRHETATDLLKDLIRVVRYQGIVF